MSLLAYVAVSSRFQSRRDRNVYRNGGASSEPFAPKEQDIRLALHYIMLLRKLRFLIQLYKHLVPPGTEL